MKKVMYPPVREFVHDVPTVFLAGSIEMGAATNWQQAVVDQFSNEWARVAFYNPRRNDWDASWSQDANSEPFNNQVHWELDMLDRSDFVLFYFEGETKAPISLLELGLMATSYNASRRVIVCVADSYWRRGNVEIVCNRAGIRVTNSLTDACELLNKRLQSWVANDLARPNVQSRC